MSESSGDETRLFDPEEVVRETLRTVLYHYELLTQSLFFRLPEIPFHDAYSFGPLRENILTLVAVANGEVDLATQEPHELIALEEIIVETMATLGTAPLGTNIYGAFAPDFWETLIGQVLRHVSLRRRGEEFIDYTTAATLLYPRAQIAQHVAVKRIARLVERGKLTSYSDPRVKNPKHSRRVSRQEIENLANVGVTPLDEEDDRDKQEGA